MLVEPGQLRNFDLKLSSGGREFAATQKAAVSRFRAALDLKVAPLFKLDLADQALVQHLTASQIEGKVVITEFDPKLARAASLGERDSTQANPALLILVDRKGLTTRNRRPRQLVDPNESGAAGAGPRITITGEDAARFFAELKTGARNATASVHIPAPGRVPVILRNVIGVLPGSGSDPALRDTYVLLTAHYDHLGVREQGSGDRIYNGANDDGSGTVSVMEVARALARLPKHPRRSIVFMTFFGEEEGLIGSALLRSPSGLAAGQDRGGSESGTGGSNRFDRGPANFQRLPHRVRLFRSHQLRPARRRAHWNQGL